MKIYTRTGDDGTTGLLGSVRVRKDAVRIQVIGDIDETNAAIGVVLSLLPSGHPARGWLDAIQSDLLTVGAILASSLKEPKPALTLGADRAAALESQIDQMEQNLKPLKNFILPQGVPASAQLHVARAIARRAERTAVGLDSQEKLDPTVLIFLNRLSDFLFVLARWVNVQQGGQETAWLPPAGAAVSPHVDRLAASLGKLEQEKERRKSLFEKTTSDLQKRKEEAERNFRQNVDQIKKDGGKVEKPVREIDLD